MCLKLSASETSISLTSSGLTLRPSPLPTLATTLMFTLCKGSIKVAFQLTLKEVKGLLVRLYSAGLSRSRFSRRSGLLSLLTSPLVSSEASHLSFGPFLSYFSVAISRSSLNLR